MKLVIVESPAKCGKIQGFLGSDYTVLASMGHIRALEESLDAVGIDKDFEPTFTFLESKSKAIDQLKRAAKSADEVYLAADDDREGEAIAYSVALLLKLPLRTTPRIVFHEITETAVKAAIAAPRHIDMQRVEAQQARAMLDMMIGFTLSPLLWSHVARGLSAGRCQTPALRLVVEREQEIEAFKGSSSWRITGDWTSVATLSPSGERSKSKSTPFKFSSAMVEDLADEESALTYLENHNTDRSATVRSNTVRPWTAAAPPPLITSTLQQQASALFGFSPKATMQIAQKLYEAGHITYMRTDKAVLSEEAVAACHAWVTETFGAEYVGTAPSPTEATPSSSAEPSVASNGRQGLTDPLVGSAEKPKKKGKKKAAAADADAEGPKAQEAHEAIRPTHVEVAAPASLEPTHAKLYGLIRQRAVQSTMAAAKGENCTLLFDAEGDEGEFPWKATWKRTTFPGWQRMGRVAELEAADEKNEKGEEEGEETEGAAWAAAITLAAGTPLTWSQLQAHPFESKPPGRYTEATLVRALESCGIGRPSTFSALISTIQDRGYAEIQDLPGKEVTITTYSLKAPAATPATTPIWPPTAETKKKKVGQEKRKLVPTDLGRHALTFLLKHFPELFDYRFTASMEARLDAVSAGTEPWKQLLRDTWASYKDPYEDLKESASPAAGAGASASSSDKVRILDAATGLKAVLSRKGPLLLREVAPAVGGAGVPKGKAAKSTATFYGWPKGIPFESITLEQANAFVATAAEAKEGEQIGEWKGKPLVKKTGRFGAYVTWGTGDDVVRMSLKEGDLEAIEVLGGRIDALIAAKETSPTGVLKTFKEYEIKVGPYGPYIYKPALKKRQFVGLPKGITQEAIATLKESDVAEMYKQGLEAKKRAPKRT
jgi:DNA topoisomerase-1